MRLIPQRSLPSGDTRSSRGSRARLHDRRDRLSRAWNAAAAPLLVGNSEARAVLDEVRAARRLPARASPDSRLRVIARRSGDRPSVGLGSLTDEGELVDRSLPLPSAGPSFSTLTEDRRRDDSTLNLSGPTVHEELDAGHEARVARRGKERRVGGVIRIAYAVRAGCRARRVYSMTVLSTAPPADMRLHLPS